MEPNTTDGISPSIEQKFREINLEKANQQPSEVPKTGNESSVKVTKSEDDLDLGGSLKDQANAKPMDDHCEKPGEPAKSVDNVDDTGIDCSRDPDWRVVESDNLPEKPNPTQVHNDKYWDERSLDRETSDLSDEEKDLRENRKDFERAARENDDSGRTFQNDVLDPYYRSGSGSAERGLDSSL